MSLLVVGSVALDSVETPFGSRDEALGGSAVYFSHAACLLHPVQVVEETSKQMTVILLQFVMMMQEKLPAYQELLPKLLLGLPQLLAL